LLVLSLALCHCAAIIALPFADISQIVGPVEFEPAGAGRVIGGTDDLACARLL